MPIMDGFEACLRICQQINEMTPDLNMNEQTDSEPSILIYALTGDSSLETA